MTARGERLPQGLLARILGGTAVIVVVLAVVAWVVAGAVTDLRRTQDRARHSRQVLAQARAAEGSVIDAETGLRGWLLTGQAVSLDPLRAAERALPGDLRRLERLVADNPVQARRAATAARDIGALRTDFLDPALTRPPAFAAIPAFVAAGGTRVDAIRRDFDAFYAEEQRLAARRDRAARDAERQAVLAVVAGLGVLALLVVAFAFYLARSVVAPVRRVADAARALEGGDLGARVPTSAGAAEPARLGRAFNAMAAALEAERRRADAQYAELERLGESGAAQLEALYAQAPVGIATFDRELRYVRVNAALAEINGRPVDAHPGRTLAEIVPDLAPAVEPVLRRVVEDDVVVADLETPGATPREPTRRRSWVSSYFPIRGRDGRVLGAGVVVRDETAARAAAAELRRLYERDHEIAATLQSALLPRSLPELDGIAVAARFRAAGEGIVVGGDFYDATLTAEGGLIAFVGDVCGKGPDAAALTAHARHQLLADAVWESRPSRLLAQLADTLHREHRDRFATVVAARIDAPTEEGAHVVLSLGGHPPALVVRAAGTVEELGRPGTLLGLADDPRIHEVGTDLRPGDALVLYTDGVIDAGAPDRLLEIDELAAALAPVAGRDAEALADALLERALAGLDRPPRDDIAVVAFLVTARPAAAGAGRPRSVGAAA